jgi:hypothetical protein
MMAKDFEGITMLHDILSIGSSAVDDKRLLESRASLIPGTYFRLD